MFLIKAQQVTEKTLYEDTTGVKHLYCCVCLYLKRMKSSPETKSVFCLPLVVTLIRALMALVFKASVKCCRQITEETTESDRSYDDQTSFMG